METLMFSWMKDTLFFTKSFLYILAVPPCLSLILYLWLCLLGFYIQNLAIFLINMADGSIGYTTFHYFDFHGTSLPEILEE